MLVSLVLPPEISINPYFWLVLLGGCVTFAICLIRFLGRKHGRANGVWQVAGVCAAGFVLVSWAMYLSFLASTLMEAVVAVLILCGCYLSRAIVRKNYGKRRRLVYLGLFLCALFPLTSILSHVGETPVVVVSPSEKFVALSRVDTTKNITVSITSVYSSAWNFRLTAQSSELLAVYLDGREEGAVEIPFLERGRESIKFLRIQASPLITNGTYNVTLNFQYQDYLWKVYNGSTGLQVAVGTQAAPKCIIATATFGSELSPAVRFLRTFRDQLVLSTRAGTAFIEVFNAWYYSFSPSVAKFVASNDPFRAAAKVSLYPLLTILGLSALAFSVFSGVPEFAVVMAGLIASSLIGIVYLTPWIFVIASALVKRRTIKTRSLAKVSLALLTFASTVLLVGELMGSLLMLALGGLAIVLICLVVAPTVVTFELLKRRTLR